MLQRIYFHFYQHAIRKDGSYFQHFRYIRLFKLTINANEPTHYNYFTNDFQEYEFYSVGPKGNIKKIVRFQIVQDEPIIYNLAFGDQDPQTGIVSDSITSNNDDRDIVLATVANTINDFCDHYGNHLIYATGSTPVRTRLYQMGVNRLIDEISTNFEVYGIIGDIAYTFEKNVNYEAFLVKRR